MDINKILSSTDHTLLSVNATWQEIKTVCDEAVKYGTASVCIPPCFVKAASEYVNGGVNICTVIGFPNGYSTTSAKVFETADAVSNGADEIDMVINLGWLKDGKYDEILAEIKAVRAACEGKLLKVIIETCLLSEQEKIKMCELVSASGADYIKTSTGFSSGGATREDIALLAAHIKPHLKIKAAGGISGLADAEELLALGASRLGSSRIIKAVKQQNE